MATKKSGPATKGLQVTARRERFFRGGHEFGGQTRTVPLSDLTQEQADQIRDEGRPGGQLVVTEVDIESADKD